MSALESALIRISRMTIRGEPIGMDIFSIPIVVSETVEIASLSQDGINLNPSLLAFEPKLEIYILHEIFHEVTRDPKLDMRYNYQVANIAYDYRINQFLDELFGLDVNKAYIPGLRNKKYDQLDQLQIAAQVAKRPFIKGLPHYPSSVHHPAVISLGNKIKGMLGIDNYSILAGEPPQLYATLRKHYDKLSYGNLPGVDAQESLFILWSRFAGTPKWNTEQRPTFTHSQLLGIVPRAMSQVIDPESALFCAKYVLDRLNSSGAVKKSQLAYCHYRLHRAKNKLEDCKKREERKKLKERIKRLKLKQAKIDSDPTLEELLRAEPEVERRLTKAAMTLKQVSLNTDTPKYSRGNPLVKCIIKLLSGIDGKLEDIMNARTMFESVVSDIVSNQEHQEPQKTPAEQQGESSDHADDEECECDEDEDGEEKEGDGQGKQGASNKPSKRGSPGDGVGKGRGSSTTAIDKLEIVNLNPELFMNIVRHAQFFESKIDIPRSKVARDGMLDRSLVLGSDVQNLVSSELGRLGNEVARLSFLVDLANNNLLHYTDLDTRRSAVILMLDCSGSMSGVYEMACGFCIALIRKFVAEKRGVALILFSGSIDHQFIWNPGQPVPDILKVMTALVSPSFGGTSFNYAVQQACHIHERLKWSKTQMLMISDGKDRLSEGVIARKPKDTRLIGMLTGSAKVNGFDKVYKMVKQGLATTLVTLAGNDLF